MRTFIFEVTVDDNSLTDQEAWEQSKELIKTPDECEPTYISEFQVTIVQSQFAGE